MNATNHRWGVLATVGVGLILITLDHSVLYTALPTLVRELGATTSQSLWIINAYPLIMAGLLLGAGTLGDRIGHHRMFLSGLVVFGAASLTAAFSPTPEMLIAARAFLATGAAAMMPATLALIRLAFHNEQERNLAIAIWGSLSVVGAAAGPVIGGLLLEHFWWGSVFLINVPIVVAAFISALIITPRAATDSSKSWDVLSSLLALVSLSGLVLAIKSFASAQPSWALAASSTGCFLIAGTLFIRRQTRLAHPLLDLSLFRNPAFMAGVLAAAFTLFAMAGVQLITTQRFQLVAEFSPLEAGLLASVAALGCLPSALLGGTYLHRVGLLPLIVGGLLVAALGVFIMCYDVNRLPWVIAGLTILGLGLGAVMAVASTAIVGNAPAHRAGMASSVEEVSYEFGSLFAVAILGSLIAALYSSGLQLPVGLPENARDGIAEAMALADASTSGSLLKEAASTAFDRSYLFVMNVIAGVLVAGALVTAFLLRRHGPGSVVYNAA
ncbi:Efflux pump transporter of major facilitator superfamily (MFS) [Pseudomonas chlororaphis]|uniref:Efflux pump transporter of major facilitator superfamily (MFS) n=2 Tax=Pseudomonas chlororaphis TaxID=587753 RepID=A0A3G7TG31_9PSED|nr:Efflux pump transporter of major facilitator superfamily (MFS) [Pseudomonas chlororaphis]